MNNAPIGVFDSGMGGLTVLRALAERLPSESLVYLGDTARLPYGTKSSDTVRRYAIQASRALVARGVKMIVIACNTASVSLAAVQDALAPLPVVGVIEPGAAAAISAAPAGPIAVIATEGTVRNGAYVSAILARAPDMTIMQQACPLFVPIAEEGLIDGPIAEGIAHRYLDPLLSAIPKPKCLLLGCTHYPVLKQTIARIAPEVTLVDSAMTTADAVVSLLRESGLAKADGDRTLRFLVTDAPDRFARIGENFFGQPIDPGAVELIDLQ
ncbi:MAG TPA: glutamate racemase [Rhizomicrobium sp.]|nr:glutamate racemase [Rhizomicrobium sp.]